MRSRKAARRRACCALSAWAAAGLCAAQPGEVRAQTAGATSQTQPQPQPASGSAASRAPKKPAPAKPATVRQITVTAHADRVRSSPDSRSYDLTQDPQASTGSVADVLRNVPSVQVSPNGKLSLRGDPGVVVYVDGKPSSLFSGPGGAQALQSMPADQYERVEVMTSPSAAYAPDGAAGIINLITKKNRKPGRWGSLKVAQGSQGRRNASFTAGQHTARLTLSFNAGIRHDRGGSTGGDRRETLDGPGVLASTLDTASRSGNAGDSGYAHGSAEWNPNDKTQVTAELTGWAYQGRWSSLARFDTQDPTGETTQLLQRSGGGDYQGSGLSGNLTYRRSFDSNDHTLVVSLTRDLSTSANSSLTTQTNLTPPAPDSFDELRKGEAKPQTELKGDYVRPMPLEATLKTGVDIRDEGDNTDPSGFLAAASPDAPNAPGQTDVFRFDRRISAAYATYTQPIGRLTVLAGLRVEDTELDLNEKTTSFTSQTQDVSPYPTLNLTWKLTERQQLRASYSERVQRPSANQYDPFLFVYGPYSESRGNPDLRLEQSQKFELGWEFKHAGAYYSATAYYKDSEGGVTNVVTDLGDGVFLSTPENLSRNRNGGLELVASGRLTRTLNYNLSATPYWNEVDASALGFAPRSGWSQSAHAGLDWQATPKDLLQVQGSLSGRQLNPQGYSQGGPQVNLGYRRKLDNRFTLQLTAQDVFAEALTRYAAEDMGTFSDAGWRKTHDRVAYASLIWTFGRGRNKAPGLENATKSP